MLGEIELHGVQLQLRGNEARFSSSKRSPNLIRKPNYKKPTVSEEAGASEFEREAFERLQF